MGYHKSVTFFQIDNGILLKFSHCTNDGIDTQRAIGTVCSSRTVERALSHYSTTNTLTVSDAITRAIEKKTAFIIND